MPLVILGTGTQTKPAFREGALPADTLVPNRREAVEALGIIGRLASQHGQTVLIDNEVVTWDQALDTLRRFILTR